MTALWPLLGGCGGGGSCATCGAPTPTPTPTPAPSPTPTPAAFVWKTAFAPAPSANILTMLTSGNTVFGAGVEANSAATDTSAYAVAVTDNGTTVSTAQPNSLAETSDILGMVLLNATTAFAVGKSTPANTGVVTPTVFILGLQASGVSITKNPLTCPAGTPLAPILQNSLTLTAVVQDGTTMFIAARLQGDVPAIFTTDTTGAVNCAQTPIRVIDANARGIVHSIHVSGSSLFVAGDFNALAQGFVLRLDKATGVRNWEEIVSGTPIASMVVDDANGLVYAGGTKIATQDAWVVIQFHPPDTAPVWAVQPITPSQAQTADSIVALLANPAGGVIAVGQTTPAGQADPNNVQTAVAVISPSGTTTAKKQVTIFSGDQEHAGAAILGPNSTLYIGGTKFTPNVGNAGAWLAKLNLP